MDINKNRAGWNLLLVVFVALGTLSGCGGEKGPDLAKVTGKVIFNGEPLADALVTFSPNSETARGSMGTTNEQGVYVLEYTADKSGVPVGEYRVSITSERAGFSDESGAGKHIEPREEILPIRYHAETELKATVNPGENTIDFDLKPGGPTKKAPPKFNDA